MSFIKTEEKIFFYHIPKCAGTYIKNRFSVFNYLRGNPESCVTVPQPFLKENHLDVHKEIAKKKEVIKYILFSHHPKYTYVSEFLDESEYLASLDDLITFTTIRNPWARVLSFYCYMCESHIQHEAKNFKEWNKKQLIPRSEEFIAHAQRVHNLSFKDYVSQFDFSNTQTCFLTNHFKNLNCFLRQEDLENQLDAFSNKFNISLSNPILGTKPVKVNTTDHTHYTDYYDDESIKIVAELEKDFISHFGYKYGD